MNEDFLNIIEDMGLLQQLQISKPNNSVDVLFRTEDAAGFYPRFLSKLKLFKKKTQNSHQLNLNQVYKPD